MARYIDADALIEALQTDYDRQGVKADEMALKGLADISVKYSHGQFCFLNAIERVKDTPTADVVPKSEVENIFAEIELEIKEALYSNYEARRIRLKNKHEKREIPACYCGDEFICICDGKITALRGIEYFLAELKKKYMEKSK